MKVTTKDRQNLADIAMQIYGCVDAVPIIARANDISMSEDLSAGTVLECPDVTLDLYKQNYARNNNVMPATAE